MTSEAERGALASKPEPKEAKDVHQTILEELEYGYTHTAISMAKKSELPLAFMQSEAFQQAAQKIVIREIEKRSAQGALDTAKIFQVPTEKIPILFSEGLCHALRSGYMPRIVTVLLLMENENFPHESFESPEIRAVAKDGVEKLLKKIGTNEEGFSKNANDEERNTLIDGALWIIKRWKLSLQEIKHFFLDSRELFQQALAGHEKYVLETLQITELDTVLTLSDRPFPATPETGAKLLNRFLNDQTPLTALRCLETMEKHGLVIRDEALKKRIATAAEKEKARRENRIDHDVPKAQELPRQAHEMAANFYVIARLRQNIDLFRDELFSLPELSFRLSVRLADLCNSLDEKLDAMSFKLHRYLLTAIDSELQHQKNLASPHRDAHLPPLPNAPILDTEHPTAQDLARWGTKEETIVFLQHAAYRLLRLGWTYIDGYGTETWEDITKASIALTQNPKSLIAMDHVFDLEHNNGNIFDKDEREFKQDRVKLKRMLTEKAKVAGGSQAVLDCMREKFPELDLSDVARFIPKWEELLLDIQSFFGSHIASEAARKRISPISKFV